MVRSDSILFTGLGFWHLRQGCPVPCPAPGFSVIMSSFPVLKNRPIDQWKVTELKDELRKRRLPVKGLKEELVRRLFESIQSEEASDESAEDVGANEGTPIGKDAKDVGANGPADQVPEEHTASQKTAVSATEVCQETRVHATQETAVPLSEVTQEIMASSVEQSPGDNVVATHESLSTEAPTEKGDRPEAVAGENSTVQAGHQHFESNKMHIEETPEVVTNGTTVVADVTSADLKSDLISSEAKSDTAEASKTDKQDTLPKPVDAQIPDADPTETDVAAASMNNDGERFVPKNDMGDNASIDNEVCSSDLMNEDHKPIVSKSNNQVPEVSPDLGSPIKCESISSDDISNNKKNIKDNLNANNFDLELEVKPEMVKPSSGITSLGGELQPLDGDKELVKNQFSLEDIDSTANVDEVGSPEKLNLDRSSGDESMEDDVVEIKQLDFNVKSDDLRGKTEPNSSEHVKEVCLPDSVVKSSSADTKEVIAEEKPSASTEKRKFQAQETVANTEPIKRQRRWAADSGNVPERQPLSQSGSDARKDILQPALKRSLGRSDSTASGDSPKERIVPPSQKPATTSLRIDRFVRPFTLRAVQELLGKTGSVCSFWMDHIKTHCYVTFSSVEEATATRDAVYNLQWPPNNGNYLLAEFVDPQEVKLKLEPPPPPPAATAAAVPISPATTPREAPFQQGQANQSVPRQAAATPREQLPPPPPLVKPPTSDPREKLPPTPKKAEPPVVTLDDLFRKTQSSPRIYYLPLSDEEVSAKLAAQGKAN
uniref:SAP domain-containing protein n=1 Tax=Aegilops tauschii subsp. strangulata TaxID=200361 RepID=A0A453I303_AEGTS